jgi:hypothetical protein
LQVIVPSEAKSGTVYLEVATGLTTNALPLTIQKSVNIHVALSWSLSFDYSQLSVLANGQDITLDSSYQANVNVENQAIDYLASFVDIDGEVGLLYESVVLPDDVAVELSALSTAAKWIFFGLQYSRSQPQEKWKDIIEVIKSTQETIELADYIDVLLEWDHIELSRFNDDVFLITMLQEAQTASANAVNAAINVSTVSQNKALSAKLTDPATSISSDVLPSDIQDEVHVTTDNDASINVINHNNMFLSVQAITEGKRTLSSHIQSPFDSDPKHGFIGGTGWVFNTIKKLLALGEDTHLEVLTGGLGGYSNLTLQQQMVHKHLVKRTVISGFIAPAMDAFMKKVFNKNVNVKMVIELVGPTLWSDIFVAMESNPDNLHNVLLDVTRKVVVDRGVLACYQDAASDLCKTFVRVTAAALGITQEDLLKALVATVGKKGAAYLVPYIGQIYAAYDNISLKKSIAGIVLTADDFLKVSKKIDFDVKFGLVIGGVSPLCTNAETDKITIAALGITPVKQYIWWGEYTNPKVEISGRELKIASISEPAAYPQVPRSTNILYFLGIEHFRLITVLLSDEDKLHIGDGVKSLTLMDKDEKLQYIQPLEFGVTSLKLNELRPAATYRGYPIILLGCGFSKNISANDVYFTCDDITVCPNGWQKAVVLEADTNALSTTVPQEAVTGDVTVRSLLQHLGYYKVMDSNPLKFTLGNIIDPCSWNGKPVPEYCSPTGSSTMYVDTNDNETDQTYVMCQYYGIDYGVLDGKLQFESPIVNGRGHGIQKYYGFETGEKIYKLLDHNLYENGILINYCKEGEGGCNDGKPEVCDDGIDNDCNGQTDCNDTACADDDACNTSSTDCSKEYETFHALELTLNRYCGTVSAGGLICSRYNFTNCSNACVSTTTWSGHSGYSPDAGDVFNAGVCNSYPGYISCASGAFTTYISCLEGCNAAFLNGKWGTEFGSESYVLSQCAPACKEAMDLTMQSQCVAK